MAHLWTNAPAPLEYVEVQLCREFGWTLALLRRQPAEDVFQILDCLNAEGKVTAARARKGKRDAS